MIVGNQGAGRFAVRLAAQARSDRQIALASDDAPNPLITQGATNGRLVKLLTPLHGGIDIHLKLEMHAAAQIQAQLHGLPTQVTEPRGGGGRQVQGHNKAIPQGALHPGLRHKLLLGVAQPHQCIAAARVDHLAKVHNAGFLQRAGRAAEGALINDLGTAFAGDLQRRVWRVQVGGGVKQSRRQHREHQQVFPQGVLIQHNQALTGYRASANAPQGRSPGMESRSL